jgi:2-C-methyl-D-erythritol 4-phosphate cytidylyltransferase
MNAALIVAAGKGTRMGANVDKLFLDVAGQPVIAHTWRRFDETPAIGHLVIVVREGMQEVFSTLAAELKFRKPFTLVGGGRERQDSVWNGLQALPQNTEIVAIQDGARPCTSCELIEATLIAARETGAAVAACRVTDTIKESDDGTTISRTADRAKLWAVQTPQTFRVEIIRRALGEVRRRGLTVTDDTAACELIQQPVRLVALAGLNPKVTSPGDLLLVQSLLAGRNH